jgi:tetratricopeptide (TPR) repeat protein
MTQAVTAGGSAGGENIAYVQTLLGNLLVNQGRLDEAAQSYADAQRSFPGFPAARAGHARILVAAGRYAEAARVLDGVVKVQPLSEYAIAEGDAWKAAGRKGAAANAYELVGAITRLYRANGVNVDLEIALFDADHHPGKDAVARAKTALEGRPSILGHDVLAWNLYRNGQTAEAAKESKRALATGSRDPGLRFHAAAIAAARGQRAEASADLQIVMDANPRFSAGLVTDVSALARKLGMAMPPPPAIAR